MAVCRAPFACDWITMSPYENLPPRNFWKTGVAQSPAMEMAELYIKKFDIPAGTQIATAGSCFAQHIKRHMSVRGFEVLDLEPPPLGLPADRQLAYGFGLFSARYGNIYTVRQLLQLAKEALGLLQPAQVVWKKGERFVDGLRPAVEPAGFADPEAVLLHRRSHLAKVKAMLERMNLMIFTLGLTEAWVDGADGVVYPTAPGTIAIPAGEASFEFSNFTTAQTIADFLEFRALVRAFNPSCRFLLTVSPVPLTATASTHHVLIASSYSKAALRAAAGELAAAHPDIDYFPSFELISAPVFKGAFFEANQRTVTPAGVQFVMDSFFRAHPPPPQAQGVEAPRLPTGADEACEDALLEAFVK
jgi:hypothetical protein